MKKIKTKKNQWNVGGFISDKKSCYIIYINFNIDFLGLDNVYFENYFVNEHTISFVF